MSKHDSIVINGEQYFSLSSIRAKILEALISICDVKPLKKRTYKKQENPVVTEEAASTIPELQPVPKRRGRGPGKKKLEAVAANAGANGVQQ